MIQAEGSIARKNWRGRDAVVVSSGVAEAVILPGGGHLAGLRFVEGQGPTQANVLWEPPWETYDADTPASRRVTAELGEQNGGRYLASYTGHALCLDGFGAASAADTAAGVSLHGEASVMRWTFTQPGERSATGAVTLPVAGLRVEREFSLMPGESVLRVEEKVINLRDAPRALHWVQHATFGAPVFPRGARATASVREGMTAPIEYEGHNLLAWETPFTWPMAPAANGGKVDLREMFSSPGEGFHAGAHQAERRIGFVAVCHAGLAAGYLFRTEDYPWVTFWEENLVRQSSPWLGQAQARGLEFGTTPLPLGNEEVDARGPLFGKPTSRNIGARQTLHAPWLMFVAEVPHSWHEIEDARIEEDAIVLTQADQQVRVRMQDAAAFFS
ncbi:MAG: hypothetical protein FWD64_07090 [Acidobacteriaceae bacterium]|nr:hypothetical protein [Acidobacteriaceae bacterium]